MKQQGPSTDIRKLEITQLTFERAGFMESAYFSPDARTVVYSARFGWRPFELYETRPGFVSQRSLGIEASGLYSISTDGMLVVQVGDGVAEVPMTGGVPRKLIEGSVGDAQWQPNGRNLAVVRVAGGKQRIEMPPGRVLYETVAATGWADFRTPPLRWSPDGRYLAMWEGVPVDGFVVIDTTGRVMARGTAPGKAWGSAWSADGKELWYVFSRDGVTTELRAMTPAGRVRDVARLPGVMAIWDIARDGRVLMGRYVSRAGIRGSSALRPEEQELGWFDYSYGADISRDGRLLLFTVGSVQGGEYRAVCMRGMDGSPPVRLGEGVAMGLSPDGKWALALQNRVPPRLVLLPTGAGDSLVLPRHNIESYLAAGWMPDGKRIVFNGAEAGRTPRTYLQDITGGTPRPITPEGVVARVGPHLVSPDGQRVLYQAGERYHVKAIEADSGSAFADVLPRDYLIGWTADGDHVYVAQRDSTLRIATMNVRTGVRKPWKTLSIGDPDGWLLGSIVVTPDGRAHAVGYVRGASDLFLVSGLK